MKKYIFPIILVCFIFIALLIKFFVPSVKPIKSVACTEEAKICSDGSAVTRSGPNCEFAPCPNEQNLTTADFVCADSKTIGAIFDNGEKSSVKLNLSDGRSMNLPSTISASGSRYASPDESVIFWNKGDTAFIEENGKPSFNDCVTKK